MSDKTRIYVPGTFDCFHAGHVHLLARARELADFVVVAVRGDALDRDDDDPPVMSELERLAVLRACRYVDLAFVVESHDAQRRYLELIRPDLLLHGDDRSDATVSSDLGVDPAFLSANGITTIAAPYAYGVSTPEIRRRIIDEHHAAHAAEHALTLLR